jgi:hypothetical protein
MDLRFNGSTGKSPEPESKEELFLVACCIEDRRIWRDVVSLSADEIHEAIENLQRLGWGFELVTLD